MSSDHLLSSSVNQSSRLEYLKSLGSIRERCSKVFQLAIEQDQLEFWSVDQSTLPNIVDFCSYLISRDYAADYQSIPPHGRWRHFLAQDRDRIGPLINEWRTSDSSIDSLEIGRRLVDLFVVAVLMDAGAGDEWVFTEPAEEACSTSDLTNAVLNQGIGRSEGLAVGTLHAFKRGVFSSDPHQPHQVDPIALESLTTDKVAGFMQSKPGNQMVGLEGRSNLLQKLGSLLSTRPKYFPTQDPSQNPRPGNLIDYIISHPRVQPIPRPVMQGQIIVPVDILWEVIIDQKIGLGSIWPKEGREPIDGEFIGDVWTCQALNRLTNDGGHVPFHKLSQWLTYSLIEVLEKSLKWVLTGTERMTGLPEYRNGGLLIDFEYIKPKPISFINSLDLTGTDPSSFSLMSSLPPLPASHPAIVEWRALTVIGLDRIRDAINQKLELHDTTQALSLPQVLEAATWKGGREIAKIKRSTENSQSAGPPLKVISDGTVF